MHGLSAKRQVFEGASRRLGFGVCGWSVHLCRRQLSGVAIGCLKQSELGLGPMHHDTAQLFIVSSALVLPVEM